MIVAMLAQRKETRHRDQRLAQSLVLFPLRNQAILCLAALAIVLLARSPGAAPAPPERGP
jgi:hypothetical protein